MGDIYQPLPRGDWIRVLEVHEVDSELFCNFKYICIDNCNVDYSAISYAWEDTTPVSSISFPDERSLPLSRTLVALFDSLRQGRTTFTVWIDALCINQIDPVEKAHQVSMMGRVYACAKQVLLWLGESDNRARAAFRFMQLIREHGYTTDDEIKLLLRNSPRPKPLRAVLSLLARPWFRRVWVIQEITVNPEVTVACGVDQVPFGYFRDSVFAIWKFHDMPIYDGPRLRGLWNATRVIQIREKFLSEGPLPYEDLLETAYHVRATDDRDMVFSFWGIGDHRRPIPEPSYSITVEDLYAQTAEALLCHGTSLDALALSGISMCRRPTSLPTWVLDPRNHSFSEPFVSCDNGGWDAGGHLQVPAQKCTSSQLQLDVAFLGVVDEDCPVFQSWSVLNQQAALRSVLELRHRIPGTISYEQWLEVVWPSLILGLDIDDEPVGSEYREHFNEWLTCLLSSTSGDDIVQIQQNIYHRTMAPRVDDWKAFLTQKGTFCIGPPEVQVGDLLSQPYFNYAILTGQEPDTLEKRADKSIDYVERVRQTWATTSGEDLACGGDKSAYPVPRGGDI
ncbi:hypothetical protein N8I77_011529 [Diaporthe amygdali]|uniref:Heterokaryon incompatibility domain-containing protein n=1 Tax=Phomopsis amygdali TaxID=1214568 RepID=A0AAD9S6H6_PHOAM|nr:hypothetical protein N8I77_011529 [Diaporthe amygdali]